MTLGTSLVRFVASPLPDIAPTWIKRVYDLPSTSGAGRQSSRSKGKNMNLRRGVSRVWALLSAVWVFFGLGNGIFSANLISRTSGAAPGAYISFTTWHSTHNPLRSFLGPPSQSVFWGGRFVAFQSTKIQNRTLLNLVSGTPRWYPAPPRVMNFFRICMDF